MSERDDREHLELALLLLAARSWFLFYTSEESAVTKWQRDNLKRLGRFEERARRAYQSALADFRTTDLPSGQTIVNPSIAATARLERSVGEAYTPAFGRDGQFRRRGLRRIDAADRAGTDELRTHMKEASALAKAVAADEAAAELDDAAGLVNRGTARSQSRWALDRDIEVLERKTRHRAGLAGLEASGGGGLSSGLSEAGRAVKVSRSSLQNTMAGTSRHATRQSIYTNARRTGVFGSQWMGVSPLRGALVGRAPLTPDQWARVARRGRVPSAWSVVNPVGTWGMHPGSRTFFAPTLAKGTAAAIASGLLLLRPDLPKRLEVSSGLSLVPSPVVLDGTPVESLGDLAEAVFGELREEAASVDPWRQRKEIAAAVVSARVSLVHQGTNPSLIVLDRGTAAGIGRGLVMNVRAGSRGGGLRGQIVVTSSFNSTSVAVVGWKARGGGSFRIGDFATTAGERALGA